MQNKLFATIIAAMLVLVMAGTAMCAGFEYDSNVTLENKDTTTWQPNTTDDITALIEYNSVGEEFAWHINVTAAPDEDYSLIYYADKPDRFNDWGGDNPGVLIKAFTTDSNGDYDNYGYTELNMNLPHVNDSNIDDTDGYNYTTSDGYDNAFGAKLWIVLSDDYTEPALTAWNPVSYLFETDLIAYEDCGDYYLPLETPANATFTIGDAFNTTTVPIMVLNATNAGSVDMTLTYNASVVEITGIMNGDMDSMFYNEGTGKVRIGAYQGNSAGLNGDFVLVNVTFERVGDGSCDNDSFGITVTTYKDATPCGRSMPYIIDTGIYCACLNGDVNCDGDVDMFDVMYIAKYSIGLSGFEDICECAADVDGSGNIDIADASYLARYIIGLVAYDPLK